MNSLNKLTPLIILFALPSLLFLTGCTAFRGEDCPLKGGLSCHSLADVDRWVDKKLARASTSQAATTMKPPSPYPLHIWIAPYTDAQGTVYKARWVTTYVKQPLWQPTAHGGSHHVR